MLSCVPIVDSFLLLSTIPMYSYITICLFIHLLIDSCVSNILLNRAAMNIHVQVSVWV